MKLGTFKAEDDKVMTKRQVAALLYGAHRMKTSPVRSFQMAFDAFLLMYVLGLRIGEVIRLRYSNVGVRNKRGRICSVMVPTEKKAKSVTVTDPETGKRRAVSRSVDPLDALHWVPVLDHAEWVAIAFDPRTRSGAASTSEWLFPGRNPDRHISDRMIDYAFRAARKAGRLPDVYSSHCLRHTAGTEIMRKRLRLGDGRDEAKGWTRRFLRHSKKAVGHGGDTTDAYIHLGPRTLPEWAPMMEADILKVPEPLAPCGPSQFDPENRYGR